MSDSRFHLISSSKELNSNHINRLQTCSDLLDQIKESKRSSSVTLPVVIPVFVVMLWPEGTAAPYTHLHPLKNLISDTLSHTHTVTHAHSDTHTHAHLSLLLPKLEFHLSPARLWNPAHQFVTSAGLHGNPKDPMSHVVKHLTACLFLKITPDHLYFFLFFVLPVPYSSLSFLETLHPLSFGLCSLKLIQENIWLYNFFNALEKCVDSGQIPPGHIMFQIKWLLYEFIKQHHMRGSNAVLVSISVYHWWWKNRIEKCNNNRNKNNTSDTGDWLKKWNKL